ncbi:hypothetical protein EVAR_58958_1 [Eumeta japonica]|uniref:Uncharacterized protein n=1 Tax=Eumeta variegata TaxID=151549 RepID=A0A4C1YIR5_EUMVA|nr:hypothetical protein EVAR_58958_1 [Eumeta japonica]
MLFGAPLAERRHPVSKPFFIVHLVYTANCLFVFVCYYDQILVRSRNPTVPGFYHGSCNVFVDEGLFLLDIHVNVQDYVGGLDGYPSRRLLLDDSASQVSIRDAELSFWTTRQGSTTEGSPAFRDEHFEQILFHRSGRIFWTRLCSNDYRVRSLRTASTVRGVTGPRLGAVETPHKQDPNEVV